MAEPPTTAAESAAPAVYWEAVQDSPAFAHLRHALRSFVFPVTIAFRGWYFRYVLCGPSWQANPFVRPSTTTTAPKCLV